MPMDMGPAAGRVEDFRPAPLPERTWVQPIATDRAVPDDGDPAELLLARESIRLAFVAALQLLPPRQRAVLILREVLRWRASEVAALLETSVASVNSALQRARATLAAHDASSGGSPIDAAAMDDERRALLDRYVDAFERFDVEAFVALLHEDATLTMPPDAFWLRGRDLLGAWWAGPGRKCAHSIVVRVSVNGTPGCASYRVAADGGHEPFAIQVLETADGLITGVHAYRDPALFAQFGLPSRLDH
jgi:RNA polymerase sigma-70 factor (ECF subfamily)